MNLKKFYSNKKILVTGHTGFKGSWLVSWLDLLGANIVGVSKGYVSKPSHFELLKLKKKVRNYFFDICDYKKIKKIIEIEKPEIIFHLAAQSLVSESFKNTRETILTNTIGTTNILDIVKELNFIKSVIIVTSDKCYKNVEKNKGYKETDILAGIDPYSASKSCAEIIFSSYCEIIKKRSSAQIVSVRAGNVIGGGDWATDRVVPDLVKAYERKEIFFVRNPYSTRPWQHVLEPIKAYLLIAKKIYKKKNFIGESYNVGPNTKQIKTVLELIKKIKIFRDLQIKKKDSLKIYESRLLSLNSNKIKKNLKISPTLSFNETSNLISDWYESYFKDKESVAKITKKQILNYSKKNNILT